MAPGSSVFLANIVRPYLTQCFLAAVTAGVGRVEMCLSPAHTWDAAKARQTLQEVGEEYRRDFQTLRDILERSGVDLTEVDHRWLGRSHSDVAALTGRLDEFVRTASSLVETGPGWPEGVFHPAMAFFKGAAGLFSDSLDALRANASGQLAMLDWFEGSSQGATAA